MSFLKRLFGGSKTQNPPNKIEAQRATAAPPSPLPAKSASPPPSPIKPSPSSTQKPPTLGHQYNSNGFCNRCGWERQFLDKTQRTCITDEELEQKSRHKEQIQITPQQSPQTNPAQNESADIIKRIRDSRNYDSTQLDSSYTVKKFISNGGDARLFVREIVPLLKDSDRFVRSRTAIALGRLSYEDSLNQALSQAVDPLIDALADDYHEVVEYAILPLVKIDPHRAVEPLSALITRTIASSRPDCLKCSILSRAFEALGSVQDPRAVAALIAAFQSAFQSDMLKGHRGEIARALGKMGAISAIPVLTEALKRSDLGAWNQGLIEEALNLLNTQPTRQSPPAVASVPTFKVSTPTIEPAEAKNKLAQLQITYDEDAFITCSKEGKTDAVKLFLHAGMKPDAKTYDGKTALMGAAREGHVEIVQALLANGAEVNAKDDEGMTPLFNVQKIEVAQALLDKGADVNANNKYNWTPLMYAAGDGHNAVIQILLTKGAEINAKDGQGRTALMKAAQRGHVHSVKTLLAGGADVNAQTITGETAHALAAKGGHTDVVAILELQPSYKSDARKEPKAELIAMISKLTENWMTRGGTEILDRAAKEIAGSNNFGMNVVRELVLDSFFSRLPMDCREGDIGSVSMRVGAAMDGPTFARWLGENIVVGREPSQMRNDFMKYGRFGMWQEAKELCQKLGITFK
jgi:hypothetical protein